MRMALCAWKEGCASKVSSGWGDLPSIPWALTISSATEATWALISSASTLSAPALAASIARRPEPQPMSNTSRGSEQKTARLMAAAKAELLPESFSMGKWYSSREEEGDGRRQFWEVTGVAGGRVVARRVWYIEVREREGRGS